MLHLIDTYSVLAESKIEGIEPIVNKYQLIYTGIKKKPYDILDHRKLEFDHDYVEFKKQMNDLEVI